MPRIRVPLLKATRGNIDVETSFKPINLPFDAGRSIDHSIRHFRWRVVEH
jgi:hypothetical protein